MTQALPALVVLVVTSLPALAATTIQPGHLQLQWDT